MHISNLAEWLEVEINYQSTEFWHFLECIFSDLSHSFQQKNEGGLFVQKPSDFEKDS